MALPFGQCLVAPSGAHQAAQALHLAVGKVLRPTCHGIIVAHMARKRSPSHEVDEAAVAELKHRADFVVSGIGD